MKQQEITEEPIDSKSRSPQTIRLRRPEVTDGAAIHELVRDLEVLDTNSRYAYLLLCEHFRDTCVVAEDQDSRLLGFVTAFIPPLRPNTIFVWQIAVAPQAHRRGLARRMLRHLLLRPVCQNIRQLHTNVAPSNLASRKLFTSLARELGVPCRRTTGFAADDFGDETHEDEELLRIGPWETLHANL